MMSTVCILTGILRSNYAICFDRAVELYDRIKAEEAAELAEDERAMNELIEEIDAAMSKG